MLHPNEALQLYLSIKLHFTSESYDVIKYGFKTRGTSDYTKRRDRYQILKLSRHKDPKGLLIANLSLKPNLWLGDLFSNDGKERYFEWQRYREAQTYLFAEEIKQLNGASFKYKEGEHPEVLRLFLSQAICLETLTILDDFVSFTHFWSFSDPIWDEVKFRIVKYRPFVEYNYDKIKDILKRHFRE